MPDGSMILSIFIKNIHQRSIMCVKTYTSLISLLLWQITYFRPHHKHRFYNIPIRKGQHMHIGIITSFKYAEFPRRILPIIRHLSLFFFCWSLSPSPTSINSPQKSWSLIKHFETKPWYLMQISLMQKSSKVYSVHMRPTPTKFG